MNWDMLEHDGYLGAVLFDPNAGSFHGTVVNLRRDGVTFVGRTAEEVRTAFRESMEDYYAFCRDRGRAPEPPAPFVGGEPVLTHLAPEVYRHAETASVAAGTSVDEWVADCVAAAVAGRAASTPGRDRPPSALEPADPTRAAA